MAINEQREHHEIPRDFDLTITITRHGPKASMHSEDLSETGRQDVADYFQTAYENVPIDNKSERRVVSSKVNRVVQSANVAEQNMQAYSGAEKLAIEQDDRISEIDVNKFVDNLSEEDKKDWFKLWFKSDEGKKAVANFCDWILDQIDQSKNKGGKIEVDAYSHGPLMAAFMFELEDFLGKRIITEENISDEQRLNRNRIFGADGVFDFVTNVNIHAQSSEPNSIKILFKGKEARVDLNAVRQLKEKYA